MTGHPLHIGFIPLVDAAALIIAVDKGFTAAEGLDVTLVREVLWSNIRDKLIHGLFDASHMLAPLAVATSLGIGNAKVPLAVPFGLNANGNNLVLQGDISRRAAILFRTTVSWGSSRALNLFRISMRRSRRSVMARTPRSATST